MQCKGLLRFFFIISSFDSTIYHVSSFLASVTFYSSSCLLHPSYLYLSPNLYLPFLPFLVLHLGFLFELNLILGMYLEPDEPDECSLFALQLYQ